MKQILCVRLPHWSIDRIKRKQVRKNTRNQPQSKKGPAGIASATPLVLVRTIASRQLIVHTCENAMKSGVNPGMTLAEATALCAGLTHHPHNPEKDMQALHHLARWMIRFSPVVAIEPPDALFLDITGSERLFHGLDRLAELVQQALDRLGLQFQLAIAETPGMAWALTFAKKQGEHRTSNVQRRTSKDIQDNRSHFSSLQCSTFDVRRSTFNVQHLKFAFESLPINALRLHPDQLLSFHHLGIHTIGQLMQLPRETIPSRFGQSVLLRLDQALGKVPEPLVPIAHHRPIQAKIEFDSGIDSLVDLWEAFKLLLEQITTELRLRNCGARQLIAEFFLPGELPIIKTISLSKPTANVAVMWNLLRCSSETVKCGNDGFSGLKLSVPLFDRLSPEQLLLLDQESQQAAGEMDHLLERLRIRLGESAVLFPKVVESHLPEKAVVYEVGERKDEHRTSNVERRTLNAATADPSSLQRSTFNLQLSTFDDPRSTFILPTPEIHRPPPKQRPLHLLSPVEIHCASLAGDLEQRQPISFTHAGQVHRLMHCNGPERITGSWWEGRNKTRDYFEVEDQSAHRFWIFRVDETRKWYLHGLFDG